MWLCSKEQLLVYLGLKTITDIKQTDYWIFYLPVISKIFEIQNIRELNTTKIQFRYTVT